MINYLASVANAESLFGWSMVHFNDDLFLGAPKMGLYKISFTKLLLQNFFYKISFISIKIKFLIGPNRLLCYQRGCKNTSFNELDLISASGEYTYQYLFNGAPMYIRENVYNKNDLYNRPKSYKIWYFDGQWHLKYKYSDEKWEDGTLLFRKKTSCKCPLRIVLVAIFVLRFEFN